jgi:hypothetical protein
VNNSVWRLASSVVGLAACVGCSSEGTIVVAAYGEAFIEQGIGAEHFSDGWSVTFDRFLVSLRDIRVAGQTASDVQVDLVTPSAGRGQILAELSVDEGDYDGASFTIDRLEVEGAAIKGAGTPDAAMKSFAWVFEEVVAYQDCETATRVESGATADFQITIHADHLFRDSLVAEEPGLVFQPFADADSDRNMDGVIETDGELWEAGIGALDPGNETAPELWTWLILAARSIGHVNGEAHCTSHVIPAD